MPETEEQTTQPRDVTALQTDAAMTEGQLRDALAAQRERARFPGALPLWMVRVAWLELTETEQTALGVLPRPAPSGKCHVCGFEFPKGSPKAETAIVCNGYCAQKFLHMPNEQQLHEEIEHAAMDEGVVALDGCGLDEPDGECQHGCRSWPHVLGII